MTVERVVIHVRIPRALITKHFSIFTDRLLSPCGFVLEEKRRSRTTRILDDGFWLPQVQPGKLLSASTDDWIVTFRGAVAAESIELLRRHPRVDFVERASVVEAAEAQRAQLRAQAQDNDPLPDDPPGGVCASPGPLGRPFSWLASSAGFVAGLAFAPIFRIENGIRYARSAYIARFGS